MSTDLNVITNEPYEPQGPGPIFCQPYKIVVGDQIRDGEFFKRGKFISIDGVWDLVMSGDNNHNLEHEYQYLTNGPEVTLISLDGIYLEKPDGTACNLQVDMDENEWCPGSKAHMASVEHQLKSGYFTEEEVTELQTLRDEFRKNYYANIKDKNSNLNYHPASLLPDDAVLVIRSGAIQELITSINTQPIERKDTTTINPRTEASYQKLVGALLEIIDEAGKGHSYQNDSQLIKHLAKQYGGYEGFGKRTLEDRIPECRDSLSL